MSITNETSFVHWYETYKNSTHSGNLENYITEHGIDIQEFKTHLAEAFMVGFSCGYVEGKITQEFQNDR